MALKYDKRGIYKKFIVERTDGEPVEENAVFFVLRVDGKDSYASKALLAYSAALEKAAVKENDEILEQMSHAVWQLARYHTWNTFEVFGIEQIYRVTGKTSKKPLDPEAEYFVIRVDNDSNSPAALREYARHCEVVNSNFASDLRELAESRTWTFIDPDLLKPDDIPK